MTRAVLSQEGFLEEVVPAPLTAHGCQEQADSLGRVSGELASP